MTVSAQPVSTGSQVQLTPIWVLDIVRSIFTDGFLDPATEAELRAAGTGKKWVGPHHGPRIGKGA